MHNSSNWITIVPLWKIWKYTQCISHSPVPKACKVKIYLHYWGPITPPVSWILLWVVNRSVVTATECVQLPLLHSKVTDSEVLVVSFQCQKFYYGSYRSWKGIGLPLATPATWLSLGWRIGFFCTSSQWGAYDLESLSWNSRFWTALQTVSMRPGKVGSSLPRGVGLLLDWRGDCGLAVAVLEGLPGSRWREETNLPNGCNYHHLLDFLLGNLLQASPYENEWGKCIWSDVRPWLG